ncbi:hypothetical protein QJU93_07240 [Pasteurella skyensis]|uniref:Uncharacterized protein n=1 Tax=Phocoenobacter skyensis TaxID=97481 RepID=A0AAJ6NAD7_9PAST|nr:hypothetical protein [Pasteurella skyensis]MDP8173150.1 hypothetical protein [Pasteurella skyensis]MDP8178917.1 hypothetical protein [Pasteurella skyensis]
MKKLLIITALYSLIPFAVADNFNKAREDVKKHFISDNVEMVHKAYWVDHSSLIISISDERNGRWFKDSVCKELIPFDLNNNDISIYILSDDDFEKVKKGELEKSWGWSSHCG